MAVTPVVAENPLSLFSKTSRLSTFPPGGYTEKGMVSIFGYVDADNQTIPESSDLFPKLGKLGILDRFFWFNFNLLVI